MEKKCTSVSETDVYYKNVNFGMNATTIYLVSNAIFMKILSLFLSHHVDEQLL